MIQELKNGSIDFTYKLQQIDDNSIALSFINDDLLMKYDVDNKKVLLPLCKEFNDSKFIYLFSLNNTKYFLVDNNNHLDNYDLYPMKGMTQLDLSSNDDIFCIFSAYHLYRWYAVNRYCGRCGHKLVNGESERSLLCKECGNVIYPRINPAVIVGIRNEDKLLLTKYKRNYAHNALVAGFVEFSETLEDAVRREVKEEVGLKVKNISYYKSQPWGIAQDILVGFFCDVDGDDTIVMDNDELKYAAWVYRDDIELQPKEYSLTNDMMMHFKYQK